MNRLGRAINNMKENLIIVRLRSKDFALAVDWGDGVSEWPDDDKYSPEDDSTNYCQDQWRLDQRLTMTTSLKVKCLKTDNYFLIIIRLIIVNSTSSVVRNFQRLWFYTSFTIHTYQNSFDNSVHANEIFVTFEVGIGAKFALTLTYTWIASLLSKRNQEYAKVLDTFTISLILFHCSNAFLPIIADVSQSIMSRIQFKRIVRKLYKSISRFWITPLIVLRRIIWM